MKIYAAKQVGDVSYLCQDIPTLIQIIDSKEIWSSKAPEFNPKTHKKQYYVSLSRDLTSATDRNINRWCCGVVLDGNKLLDKYSIEPYSYAGVQLSRPQGYRVKTLTAYENGTYKLTCVNWSTISISKSMYDEIASIIEDMPEDIKQLKKYVHTGRGKRKVNGTYIKEKHHFVGKNGGPVINNKNLSAKSTLEFLKNSKINETEERIWLNSGRSININRCIKGIVISEADASKLEKNLNGIYKMLYDSIVDAAGDNFEIVTY